MKILSAVIAILGRLLGYCVACACAGAMAATLGPFCVMSFAHQGLSRFGWAWVTFWLQAVVAGSAIQPLVGFAAKLLQVLATWGAKLVLAIQSGALPMNTAAETAIQLTLGTLPMLGVGMVAGQIPTLLDKALANVSSGITGQFHP